MVRVAVLILAIFVFPKSVAAHIFISSLYRLGSLSASQCSGWQCQLYLIPESAAAHLIDAEVHANGIAPDLTFETSWIDFPAGTVTERADSDFATISDFLDDYIVNASDPSVLAEPFGHFLLRCTAALKVALTDDSMANLAPPTTVQLGVAASDGFRVRTGETLFRIVLAPNAGFFFSDHGEFLVPGLFPVEVTYFNRFDPGGVDSSGQAGVELYGFYDGGLAWPAGSNMQHPTLGQATVVPPSTICQEFTALPVALGDFDADGDVDADDAFWFSYCWDNAGFLLPAGCEAVDFDANGQLDCSDWSAFGDAWTEPGAPVDIPHCPNAFVGACCESSSGSCVDDVAGSNCIGGGEEWIRYARCAELACAALAVPSMSAWGVGMVLLVVLSSAKGWSRRSRRPGQGC